MLFARSFDGIELSEKLKERLEWRNFFVVLERGKINAILYPFLYLAILMVTPMYDRFPVLTLIFAGVFFTLSFFYLFFSYFWKKKGISDFGFKKYLLIAEVLLFSLAWGVFSSMSLAYLQLGWTSFFVLLMTCALATGSVTALSPSFFIASSSLGLMLIPPMVGNLMFVGGLQGIALGIFFFAFLSLLGFQSYVQCGQFWDALRNEAKLSAMIEAMPGTLTWINSDLVYLGVNRHQAEIWGLTPEAFVGKKLGFKHAETPLRDFAKYLFSQEADTLAQEVEREIGGEKRIFLLVGQKYNFGTEAVLLGMDLTEYKEIEKELVKSRAQALMSARFVGLGENVQIIYQNLNNLINSLYEEVQSSQHEKEKWTHVQEKVKTLYLMQGILKELTKSWKKEQIVPVSLKGLLKEIDFLFQSEAKKINIDWKTDSSFADTFVLAKKSQLLFVLLSVVQNAFQAVEKLSEKWVRLQVKETREGKIQILVTDSGLGIDADLRERMFEPLFTTKVSKQGSGMGLSVSREILQSFQGDLKYADQNEHTTFEIILSKKAA